MAKLGNSDLDVRGINLGGNVFGWTADEQQSFAVLDAYTAAGGNFIDSADLYSGGGSETIIGNWLTKRGRRDDVVIATKTGMWEERKGLSAANIAAAAEDSLRRLQVDHIDLYYSHIDDPDTPIEETLGAFDALVRAGKVRYIGASNYSAERLAESLSISDREGLAKYVALQPHYNLVERDYETDLAPTVEREGLGVLPYFALAKGFLAGKYRSKEDLGDSPRAARASSYLDERGERVLAALDGIAADRGVTVAAVSLAWLFAQPTVTAPIASARSVEQLNDLLPAADLSLTSDELDALATASGS
ncbi:alcohol dehydrogenase [Amycolatopsis thailandensis]|uniref:Alcohol dehydrogenase n=1 Tax=Amycolatopsis thailandensis TaxID=589330 RepID=A0A229SH05_9PSEU|nr:aldo/keto reductase [Amycolatopsis thailandensis]OXM58178.1 alcohol dehydrogenase [Amycolatopsis thailandensis]